MKKKGEHMNTWKSLIKEDPTDWLLEPDNPSVRYSTLRDILDKPETDPEVKEAKDLIMETGAVPKILAKQKDGYWESLENFYVNTKYRGTVWTLLVLAELYADGENDCIQKACRTILDYSQDRESGGFSYSGSKEKGGDHNKVLPCLTANMVWSLIRFGFLEDPQVQKGIDWITTYQQFDDGVSEPPTGWPYTREQCWGRHTCHMGVVKAVKALSEIPPEKRTHPVNRTIKNGVEFLLNHRIHKRSHDLARVSKPEWLEFGFPLMWNTDILEILDILTRLGYTDERMREAVDVVISRQDKNGRWNLEKTYNGRVQVNIEKKGKPSKWVTLRAVKVLKRYCQY